MNLIPFLTRQSDGPPHQALFWRMDNGKAWAVRAGDHTLVQPKATEDPAPFHLTRDIGETQDLAASEADRVEDLRQHYREWNQLN